MEIVQAYKVWGIFASYEAYAPDTHDICLVATEGLAQEACNFLQANKGQTGCLTWVDGYESKKTFEYHPALVEKMDGILTSIDQVKKLIVEE